MYFVVHCVLSCNYFIMEAGPKMKNTEGVDTKELVDALIERKIEGYDDLTDTQKVEELSKLKFKLAQIVEMDEGDPTFAAYVEELDFRIDAIPAPGETESAESIEEWRLLREQAPAEARALIAERVGYPEDTTIQERIDGITALLDELVAEPIDNSKRFLVKALGQHLALAQRQRALEEIQPNVTMIDEPDMSEKAA